jgi:hypothetical protein
MRVVPAVASIVLLLHVPALGSPARSLSPEEILDRVAKAQGTEQLPDTITDCRVRLQAVFFSEGKRLEANLEEVYQREGDVDRLRTDYTDLHTKETVVRGFDGRTYWLQRKGERAVDLSGRDYERDRKEVHDDLATLKLILKVLAPRSGESPSDGSSATWSRLPDVEGSGIRAHLLERREPGERPVRIFVDASSYRLLGVELPPTERDPRKQNLCLYDEWRGKETVLREITVGRRKVSGLRIPRKALLFVDDSPKETSDIWIHSVSLDTGVSAGVFKKPSR